MISVDVALEVIKAISRKALGELAQRAKTARVPVPNVVGAAVIGVADALFERQIEALSEQLAHVQTARADAKAVSLAAT